MYSLLQLSLSFFILFFLSASWPLSWVQTSEASVEEIVVSATRIPIPKHKTGNSTTVITEKEILRSGYHEVKDLLQSHVGIQVRQNGSYGGVSSTLIRGANSEHTLVLIDGVEMNDPSSPSRSFDFSTISLDNIERIEIIRGPQSVIYGSDAIGGVIHIISKSGKYRHSQIPLTTALLETGSYNTFLGKGGINGSLGLLDYSMEASHLNSKGFSSAGSNSNDSLEPDGFQRNSFSSHFKIVPIKELSLNASLRLHQSSSDTDGGAFDDDPNFTSNSDRVLAHLSLESTLLNELWKPSLSFSFSDHHRKANNPTDSQHVDQFLFADFRGRYYQTTFQNNFNISENHQLLVGLEYELEESISKIESGFGGFTANSSGRNDVASQGLFIQNVLELNPSLSSNIGIRLDHHEKFGNVGTFRVAPTYSVSKTNTLLKAGFGTGFRSPSLFQLFSDFGNPSLQPERSQSWEVGFDQNIQNDKTKFSLTYFENKIENLITFSNQYLNTKSAFTHGIELSLSSKVIYPMDLTARYTLLRAKDEQTTLDLPYRPRHQLGVDVGYRLTRKWDLLLTTSHTGRRFSDTGISLPSFSLFHLSSKYLISKKLEIFLRAKNIFDKKYDEVLGFQTERRSLYAGTRFSI